MIESERILLRKIELADVNDNYQAWMNDPEVMRYMESRFKTHSMEGIRSYVQSMLVDPCSCFFAIIDKPTGKHIGNLKFSHIRPVHLTADVGIIIGDKSFWGRGYAVESLKLAAAYAAKDLKLHKLWAGFYVNNEASIKSFKRAGFVEEGRFVRHWFFEGDYVDGLQMGLLLEGKP